MKRESRKPRKAWKNQARRAARLKTAILALFLCAGSSTAVCAGQWKQDGNGWCYQNDDGTWQTGGWFTDADGKSYYFNEWGYMLANTTTPDGQRVGADGALIAPVMSLPSNKGNLYYGGLRQILDSIPLYPEETTGYTDLDAELNRIFAQIITADMDTHDKLKACYDYLITHTEYGSNGYFGGSYSMAYGLLTTGLGVCDHYSAAFAVMARKIGVPVYTVGGTTHKSNGDFTPHAWCQMDFNGVTYIFDPQVEDVIAGSRGGSIMYIRFGGTAAQLADKYRLEGVIDDFSAPAGNRGKISGDSGWGSGSGSSQGNAAGPDSGWEDSWMDSDWDEMTDEEFDALMWYLFFG